MLQIEKLFSDEKFWNQTYQMDFLHLPLGSECTGLPLVNKGDLDAYLLRNLRASDLRIAKLGETVSPFEYTQGSSPKDQSTLCADLFINVGKVIAAYRNGYSIILQDVASITPDLHDSIRELEAKSYVSIVANAYLTPSGAQGFPVHVDDHDVFIFQVYGQKSWAVYDRVALSPESRVPVSKNPTKVWEGLLSPGDVLYIPAGYPHEAKTNSQSSAHITLGLYPPRMKDFHKFVLDQIAMENAELRGAVSPVLIGAKSLAANGTVCLLTNRLTDSQFMSTMVEKFKLKWIAQRKTSYRSAFSSIDELNVLGENTVFSYSETVAATLETTDTEVILHYNGASIRFPKSLHSWLEFVMQKRFFSIKELQGVMPKMTADHHLTILKKLVGDGFIKIESGIL